VATVRFSINPEDPIELVVIAAGAAVVTKKIELTIEQAAVITDSSNPTTPRAIKRSEVIIALDNLRAAIMRDNVSLND
jgi:hypothetical protein